ncbi:ankycorbin [Scaptodrosophila lebanonensis]|uniref:Ankycorbin n=1 Tax=Drosophila lebanonensis TaxID=7225 RepID=A0A6J2T2C3_DROLE|nr:ankycorbin [Scaptodrosophila lebanonensis]
MQPTTDVKRMAPAKPPRLKAANAAAVRPAKKQLQFKSPLVRATPDAATVVASSETIATTEPDKVIAMPGDGQRSSSGGGNGNVPSTKTRLAQGCSSLMYACQHGNMGQALEQIRDKPQLLRQRDRSNKNALHYCAAQDASQTRADLVAAASIAIAAPELLESADEDGFTPLHLAVIQGNLAMVNLLLANKADVNAVDNEGHSVVHWATVCGEVEALRAVLAAGACVAKPDINGGTPLHYAAQMCGASYENKLGKSNSHKLSLEILGILLGHPQSSVDVQDKDGRQPLLWAASAGSAKAVIALVKAGARVESADKDGLTAIHCAASRGHTECIDTLIGLCGAPTDLIDSNGCTALHYAVTLGHADATARLLDLEADPNRQDRKGRTPAHCGCSKGQFETLKLLKERGANLWLRNAKGDLPLHEAAGSGRRELVAWLLDQRPNQVNTTSNDGRTLLHIAAAYDYTDMCKLLLDHGGDVNAIYRNSKGMVLTPLDCALQRGHRSTAKFLQSQEGLPASKLRMAARRGNPFHEATADMVRPLKYVEKEELHDLRNSKKYVVYLKRSDSDGGDNGADGQCSCTEQTYRREHRIEHTCRKHKRRQLRRRTSSCGESKKKHACRREYCSEICRSKSNIELRRRKSRERYESSSEWDDDADDGTEDSCENCCYHKRQKQRVVHRKRCTSMRRSKDMSESDEEHFDNGPKAKVNLSPGKEHEVPIEPERESLGTKTSQSRPPSATKDNLPPPVSTNKEGTFIKSPSESAKSKKAIEQLELDNVQNIENHAVELTDEEHETVKSVVTQVDVHHDAEQLTSKSSEDASAAVATAGAEKDASSADTKLELSEEETKELSKEVERVIKIAATALSSESKSSTEEAGDTKRENVEQEDVNTQQNVEPSEVEKVETKEPVVAIAPTVQKSKADPIAAVEGSSADKKREQPSASTTEPKNETPTKPQAEPKTAQQKPPTALKQQQQQPQREQESRRSFTLLPSDSADDEPILGPAVAATSAGDEPERKSSFQVLKSDDSMGELNESQLAPDVAYSSSQSKVFQIVQDGSTASKLPSGTDTNKPDYDYEHYEDDYDDNDDVDNIDPEHDSALRRFLSSGNRQGVSNVNDNVDPDVNAVAGFHELGNGRKRRLKKRVRSGTKTRNNWKNAQDARNSNISNTVASTAKDHDSGFEPSPRAERTKIPTPRNIYTAMPRRPIYATLDGRSCSSRLENRKPGDKGACDMAAVTRSIQRNIRRYYMERKIFQHLLELKSLQIRSNKLNEAVLVKRAVDDYHKSCVLLGGETGTRLRRYNFSEYTFKNFELFLYETLKGLQKPGTYNFQNINEVYEEAERRLSPDYNAYEKALQCTTKTHRCLHAAHAYTGIPCAAYIPMMNHHTMPKFGFGPYKKSGSVSSFYLPKILTSGSGGAGQARATSGKVGGARSGGCNHKVALELSHGKSKQLISLPAEKLDSNKRYYVTFTVKESSAAGSACEAHKQQHQPQEQQGTKAESN